MSHCELFFLKQDNHVFIKRMLPWQVRSSVSSLQPFWQLHSKLPTVFRQKWSQPPLLTRHSSISVRNSSRRKRENMRIHSEKKGGWLGFFWGGGRGGSKAFCEGPVVTPLRCGYWAGRSQPQTPYQCPIRPTSEATLSHTPQFTHPILRDRDTNPSALTLEPRSSLAPLAVMLQRQRKAEVGIGQNIDGEKLVWCELPSEESKQNKNRQRKRRAKQMRGNDRCQPAMFLHTSNVKKKRIQYLINCAKSCSCGVGGGAVKEASSR